MDNEVGHNVIMQELLTLEQAVKRTRLFQHTKSACYKQRAGRTRTPRVTAEDYEEAPEVCAVAKQPNMSAFLRRWLSKGKFWTNCCCETSQRNAGQGIQERQETIPPLCVTVAMN